MEANYYYPVDSTAAGVVYHRVGCRRIKADCLVGDVTTVDDPNMEPDSYCRPDRLEMTRQRSEAAAAHVEAERNAAEDRIAALYAKARRT